MTQPNFSHAHDAPVGDLSATTAKGPFVYDRSLTAGYISPETELIGDLKCAAGIRIAGTVQGNIVCTGGDVVIEKGGLVTGSIDAQGCVFIAGGVGQDSASDAINDVDSPARHIHTPGQVILTDSAKVIADIQYGMMSFQGEQDFCGSAKKISAV